MNFCSLNSLAASRSDQYADLNPSSVLQEYLRSMEGFWFLEEFVSEKLQGHVRPPPKVFVSRRSCVEFFDVHRRIVQTVPALMPIFGVEQVITHCAGKPTNWTIARRCFPSLG